jgi:hypothetical protein
MVFKDDRDTGVLRLVMDAGKGLAKTYLEPIIGLGKQRVSASGANANPARTELGGTVNGGLIGRDRKINHMRCGACEIDVAAGQIERQQRQGMTLDECEDPP